MIANYFQKNKEYFKIRKSIILDYNPEKTNKKIKKRISKLNEFEHFSLFCEVFIEKPLFPFTKEYLSHFTKKRKKSNHKIYDFFPRSNSNTSNSSKDYYLVFNCNKDFEELIINHLKTKEYSTETLVKKLLIIKEYLLQYFLDPLEILIPTLKNQLKKTNKLFIENDTFIFDLIEELEYNKKNYNNLLNSIENKIKSLSNESIENNQIKNNSSLKKIKGNYQIEVKNEVLEEIYNELNRYDFIDIDRTSKEDFIKVFKLDWKDHDSVIHFKITNVEVKFFIECFDEDLNEKIPLTFIEHAGNIKTKDRIFKASTLYSGGSQSEKNSPNIKIIRSIFEKIKKH
ncbi:hypothetical protein [Flavobacterium helocola]|uniref:Uncharacterized protein n=1 Tax=Flavobacterium helocola TaxID=3139139 RepID=A0ABU9I9R0_9FLAO